VELALLWDSLLPGQRPKVSFKYKELPLKCPIGAPVYHTRKNWEDHNPLGDAPCPPGPRPLAIAPLASPFGPLQYPTTTAGIPRTKETRFLLVPSLPLPGAALRPDLAPWPWLQVLVGERERRDRVSGGGGRGERVGAELEQLVVGYFVREQKEALSACGNRHGMSS
jgi:hypothetical protein